MYKKISIHASAKEATLFTLIFIFPQIYFNPRLREGGDEHLTQYKIFYSYFNPRLREGGDALLMILIGIGIDFNPRLREGGDGCFNGSLEQFRISIHASAKEATRVNGL